MYVTNAHDVTHYRLLIDLTDDKVQLHRALQNKHQKDEAVRIWCMNFRRGRDSCARMASKWLEVAEETKMRPGYHAYALKTAARWEKKQTQFITTYDTARREGVDSELLDHTRVRGFSADAVSVLT